MQHASIFRYRHLLKLFSRFTFHCWMPVSSMSASVSPDTPTSTEDSPESLPTLLTSRFNTTLAQEEFSAAAVDTHLFTTFRLNEHKGAEGMSPSNARSPSRITGKLPIARRPSATTSHFSPSSAISPKRPSMESETSDKRRRKRDAVKSIQQITMDLIDRNEQALRRAKQLEQELLLVKGSLSSTGPPGTVLGGVFGVNPTWQ